MSGIMLVFLLSFPITVKDVQVQGAKWQPPQFITTKFGISPGDRIGLPELFLATRRLYYGERFSDITVYQIGPDTSAVLRISVTENPTLKYLIFVGNKKIRADEIKDSVLKIVASEPPSSDSVRQKYRREFGKNATVYLVHGGYPLSPNRVFSWKRQIEKRYLKEGYALVNVEAEVVDTDSVGYANLIMKVHEGTKIKVKEIAFHGNSAFDDKKLKKAIKTKEAGFLRSGTFKLDQWQEDSARIVEFYANHGYPRARVDSTRIRYEGKYAYLDVWITEGNKLVIHSIDIEAAPPFDSTKLYSLLKIKPGMPFSRKKYMESMQNVMTVYRDSGYMYVNVIPVDSTVDDTLLDVVWKVVPGHRIFIRKIDIEGNTKTRDYVILRELDLFPGDHFSSTKLQKSQRDLFMLNFFSNVMVNFKNTDDSSWIDLEFKVHEKPAGQLGFGATYSELEGPALYFNIMQPNFQGKGQVISFMFQYGKKVQNYRISFTEPWLGGKPHSLGFDIHNVIYYYYADFDRQETGGSVSYSQRIWNDYWRTGITYSLERVNLFNVSEYYREHYPEYSKPFWTSSISTFITRDTRNRPFFPTTGSRFTYTLVFAGGPLQGDVHYHKHTVEWSKYLPKPFSSKKYASVFWLRGGYVGGFHPDNWAEGVPYYERFFLGDIGFYGLRGHEIRSVSPIVDGNKIGGRVFGIFTFEERYLVEQNIYFLAFVDVGNTWLNVNKIPQVGFEYGLGVGMRMEIPMMGILGFDIGFDPRTREFVPHVQVGTMF